jgi:uncharacterized membrane protein
MALLLTAIMIINLVAEGIIFSLLWAWFIVTTFGLPVISIPVAIGISVIASLLTHRVRNEDIDNAVSDDTYKIALTRMLFQFLILILLLCIGWVVHFFV